MTSNPNPDYACFYLAKELCADPYVILHDGGVLSQLPLCPVAQI